MFRSVHPLLDLGKSTHCFEPKINDFGLENKSIPCSSTNFYELIIFPHPRTWVVLKICFIHLTTHSRRTVRPGTMEPRRSTMGSPLTALLIDCVAPVLPVSTRAGASGWRRDGGGRRRWGGRAAAWWGCMVIPRGARRAGMWTRSGEVPPVAAPCQTDLAQERLWPVAPATPPAHMLAQHLIGCVMENSHPSHSWSCVMENLAACLHTELTTD